MLGLVGVTPCSRAVYQQQQATERQSRLTGIASTTPAAVAIEKNHRPPKQQQTTQAAIAAATAAKSIKDVEQLDLLAVPPDQLPECIRETEAEWRRCCRQQQRWQRVFPVQEPGSMQEFIGLFETARVSNAMLLRYYQQLKRLKGG